MKVTYFHQHFSTPLGSGGNRSYAMARALVQAGHSVHMVCGSLQGGRTGLHGPFERGRRHGEVDGFRVTEFELPYSNRQRFLGRTITFLRFALRSVRVALTDEADLVFCTSTPLTAALPGMAARWLRGKSFVFEVRDLWPEIPREMGVITNPLVLGAMSALEWCAYRSAHGCVGLSPGIVDGIRRRAATSLPVVMIPNGCDMDLFDRAVHDEGERPDALPTEGFTAAFTGTHGLANGLDAVLDAAAELKRRNRSDIRLVMIGDGARKPALMERAETEGLDNCVFIDLLPKPVLVRCLTQVDVGLQVLRNVPAFYYGTSPNKFFDYLTAGLPVVTNYPGWVADLIVEHGAGVALPPDDATAFADALEALSADPVRVRKMGERARALAEREFDRTDLARRLVAFLEARAEV